MELPICSKGIVEEKSTIIKIIYLEVVLKITL